MNLYIYRTIIVPAEHAPLARGLAASLAGPPGAGLWTTGLSEDGSEPATHYVSSGAVAAEYGPILPDANALWDAVQAAMQDGMDMPPVTQTDCETLVASAEIVDIADEGPHDTFVRLGLTLTEPSLT